MRTIAVTDENYDKLKERGHFGQSFNDVISTLLEETKKGVQTGRVGPSRQSVAPRAPTPIPGGGG